jgi:superfamily I DNA/RNA helicase
MSALADNITIALGSDFLKCFSKIPRSQQKKVRNTIEDFQNDPTSSGLNFEKIEKAPDKNLCSIRIDRNYRGIVMKPESGSVYILLWVDTHDEAYDWACKKRCLINPNTGSLQIVPVGPAPFPEEPEQSQTENAQENLFSKFRDRELKSLGLPEELLPEVRKIITEGDLDERVAMFPEEVSEALYMLAAGYLLEDAFKELEKQHDVKEVDDTDFEKALSHPDSQRRFHVVSDALELQEMLNAPLEQWRVFLHPSQRRMVEMHANGPVRVLGGAGTGKTVVAMHRTKWLLENCFTAKTDRILFVTFTTNLVADIDANLSRILSSEQKERVEVVNLDAWVRLFLESKGYKGSIAYEDRTKSLWDDALLMKPDVPTLPDSFYREEWREVIQAQGISSAEEYLRASRIGRGRSLDRRNRNAVWAVFAEYRRALDDRGLKESEDAYRDARSVLSAGGATLPYKCVVVDEAQDFGTEAFKLIAVLSQSSSGEENAKPANSLFIVGDARQRIYGRKVVLGRCGIEIRGRSKRLRINYRTTEETRAWASRVLEGRDFDDLDDGVDDQRGYRSLMNGPAPEVLGFDTFEHEVDALSDKIKAMVDNSDLEQSHICVVARTERELERYQQAFESKGFESYRVRRKDSQSKPGVRFATMHRVKGIEFEHVLIVAVQEGVVPLAYAMRGCDNEVSRLNAELGERSLLYVSATRAKRTVTVSYHGKKSEFLK